MPLKKKDILGLNEAAEGVFVEGQREILMLHQRGTVWRTGRKTHARVASCITTTCQGPIIILHTALGRSKFKPKVPAQLVQKPLVCTCVAGGGQRFLRVVVWRERPERVTTESLPLWQWSSLTRSRLTCPLHCERIEKRSRVDVVLFVNLLTLFTTRAPFEALVLLRLLRLRCWKQPSAIDFQKGQEPFFDPLVNAWMPWRRRRKSHAVDPQRRKRLEKSHCRSAASWLWNCSVESKRYTRTSEPAGAASDCVVTSPQCVFDAKTTCVRWTTSCSAAHPSDRGKEQLVALKLQLVANLPGMIE